MCDSIEDVLEASDVIVIGNKDKAFSNVLEMIGEDHIVIDLMRITEDFAALNGQYQGICW